MSRATGEAGYDAKLRERASAGARLVERPLPENRMVEHAPHVIGYREYVDLPQWGITRIKAKADTGARSSAIDVADLVEIDGGARVRFDVVLSRAQRHRRVTIEAEVVRRTLVRSSLGHAQPRLTVQTKIRVGPVEKMIEVGLVCRKAMICRMLLGRQALAGDFLVDSQRTYLYGKAGGVRIGGRGEVEDEGRKKRPV